MKEKEYKLKRGRNKQKWEKKGRKDWETVLEKMKERRKKEKIDMN